MAKGFRVLGRVAVALIALIVIVPFGFRVAASVRERNLPESIAPSEGARVHVGQLDFYYQSLGPVDGPAVLFIPGAMAWSGTWRPLAERIAAAGFRTIALDLPPFGFSSRPADHDYGRVAQAARIRSFLGAMGIDRVVLIGHSFGGGATVEAAMTLGAARVRGLVVIDVALDLENHSQRTPPLGPILGVAALRNAIVASTATNPWMTARVVRSFVFDEAAVTDARVAIYQRPFACSGTTEATGDWLLSGLFRDERAAISHDESAYRAFDIPVLIVWGREDTVTPLAQGAHIAALFPRATLEVLERVNHIPHLEKVDAVAARLRPFLSALPP